MMKPAFAIFAAALSFGGAMLSTAAAQDPAPAAPPAAPATAPAAAPAGGIIQRITPEDFIAILGEVGWSVKKTGEKEGTVYLAGSFTDSETGTAYDFEVGLYRCEAANGCYDIVFTRSYDSQTPVTLKTINEYNRNQIFGCGYLTDDGKVGLSLSHTIQGGVTRQTVKEIADWWKTIVIAYPGKLAAG